MGERDPSALELVPTGWSSNRCTIQSQGMTLAEVTLGWVREGGELVVEGMPYRLERERRSSGAFILSRQDEEIVRAVKPSMWTERFEITWEGRTFELVKPSWTRSTYALREHGETVGEVRPHTFWSRRSAITMPPELPLPVVVFVAALVVLMWNREAAAAG